MPQRQTLPVQRGRNATERSPRGIEHGSRVDSAQDGLHAATGAAAKCGVRPMRPAGSRTLAVLLPGRAAPAALGRYTADQNSGGRGDSL
jgi:hypothetical protein